MRTIYLFDEKCKYEDRLYTKKTASDIREAMSKSCVLRVQR
ncbi:hypothetical protein MTBPR1_20251 [Candidatus Terasakiella magnetica]|uniref:Uncharacterized protein n=1 Tax=Candidatus Terasakiella magnetica TaxID=1867952 RepID=A0A1C3RGH8_9PROT|nr:hypothetical protein MTBPR1_20251 [Candidatus Terasakiella magnetica]